MNGCLDGTTASSPKNWPEEEKGPKSISIGSHPNSAFSKPTIETSPVMVYHKVLCDQINRNFIVDNKGFLATSPDTRGKSWRLSVRSDNVKNAIAKAEQSKEMTLYFTENSSEIFVLKRSNGKIKHVFDLTSKKFLSSGYLRVNSLVLDLVDKTTYLYKTLSNKLSPADEDLGHNLLVHEVKMLGYIHNKLRDAKVDAVGIQSDVFYHVKKPGLEKNPGKELIGWISAPAVADFFQIICSSKTDQTLEIRRQGCAQLMSGLAKLRTLRIVHQDIHLGAILVKKTSYMIAGFAKAQALSKLPLQSDHKDLKGRPGYYLASDLDALAIAQKENNGKNAARIMLARDVYAFGICILGILTLKNPIDASGSLKQDTLKASCLTENDKELLTKMLKVDPFERISARDLPSEFDKADLWFI